MKVNLLKFRQASYSLFVLFILIGAFSFYYFGYVDKKEEEINNRAFRALDRIHENIIGKCAIISKIVSSNRKTDPDSLKKNTFQKEIVIDSDANKSSPLTAIFSDNDTLVTVDTVNNKLIKVKLKDVVEPFLRKDIFDHLIIFKNGKSIYQDIAFSCNFDSARKYSGSYINIQNESYKVYLHGYSGNNLFFCGLKKKSAYRDEKFQVSPSSILIIILVILVIFMLLPLVKLVAMDQYERLKASTVLSAWTILILNTSLIFLLLLYACVSATTAKVTDANLDTLSKSISTKFTAELDSGYKKILSYEHYITAGLDNNKQLNMHIQSYDSAFKLSGSNNYTALFFVNSRGMQQYKVSRKGYEKSMNVSARDYFKNVSNNNLWQSPVNDSAFYIESIYSYINGSTQAVISKPTGSKRLNDLGLKVTALSTVLSSVIDPVLPLGYGFAVINNTGNVMFHDDKKKNLQENFIEECNFPQLFNSAIYNKNKLFIDTRYLGKNCKMLITPIINTSISGNLPLFLVTYYDTDYTSNRNSDVLILSLVFAFILFVSCCIHLFIQQAFRKSHKGIKQSLFDFEWIIPVKEKKVAYLTILAFQIIIIGLILFFSYRILLNKESATHQLPYLYIISCMVTFFVIYNLTTISPGESLLAKNKGFNRSTIISIVLINIFFIWNDLSVNNEIFIFEGIVIIIVALIFIDLRSYYNLLHKVRDKFKFARMHFRYAYIFLLVLWLIIASILPTFYFYNLCNYFGSELALQQVHSNLINKMEQRQTVPNLNNESITYLTPDINEWKKPEVLQFEKHCNYCSNNLNTRLPHNELKIFLTVALLPPFRYLFSEHSYELIKAMKNGSTNYFYNNERAVCGVVYNSQNGDSDLLHSAFVGANYKSSYCLTSSLNYFKPSMVLYLFIVGFIAILFITLKFFVERTFYVKYPKNKNFKVQPSELFNARVFLVTPPNTATVSYLTGALNQLDGKLNLIDIDMATLTDMDALLKDLNGIDVPNNIMVVNNFEYNITNFESVKIKVSLLEALINHSIIKNFILISSLHPEQMLEIFKNNIEESKNPDELLHNYEKWIYLFKYLSNIYLPLQQNYVNQHLTEVSEMYHKGSILADIEHECNNGDFLLQLKPKLANVNTPEEVILKVQELASNYYHAVWHSLSDKEKYVVYDVAQDGVINLKNAATINVLLAKGILIINNGLNLMNKSFKNFILTGGNENQVFKIEHFQSKSAQTKQVWKTVLLLIVLLLALFILITQKEMGSKLIGLLASVATTLPLMISLLGVLKNNSKK